MDNIALAQLTALQQAAGVYATSSAVGAASSGTGGFEQLLAILLGQTQTADTGLFTSANMSGTENENILSGLSQNKLTAEQQEQAIQLLMASVLTNYQTTLPGTAADTYTVASTAANTSSEQQITNIQNLYKLLEQAVDTNGNGTIEAEEYQTLIRAVTSQPQAEYSLTQSSSQGYDAGEDLILNSRFLNAANEAQKLMESEETAQAEQQVASFAEIQQAADAAGEAPSAEKLIDSADLQNKLTEEIARHSESPSLGNEFTVKLKPEGLGEITVRLTKSDGHISLNIVTESDYTAKLIAGEAANLAAALKPLDAGIAGIVTAVGQSEGYAFAGGELAQRQNSFSGGGSQNSFGNSGAAGYSVSAADTENGIPQSIPASSALDTYV